MTTPSYFGKSYAETQAELDLTYGQQPDSSPGALQQPGSPDRVDRSLGGYAADVLLAPFRGIEGAAQDLYGLADTLTGDALPDWKRRVLGESETLPGSLIEGIANFAIGFIPVYGQLGKVAKLGKIGKGVIAGAVADFALFDGNEARLSNLLEQVPALQNPVTAFLAADDDDPEILGRLKNTVEGMGLGAIVDGLVALKAARKARAAGASPAEVAQAVADAVPEARMLEAAARPDAVKIEGSGIFGEDPFIRRAAKEADLLGKGPDELYALADEAKASESALEESILGADVKEWRRNVGKGTDEAVAKVEAIEAKLTKEQRDQLYGIGNDSPSEETLREYARRISTVQPEDTVDEALRALSSDLDELRNAPDSFEQMGPLERMAAARINYIRETWTQAGRQADLKELGERALKVLERKYGADAEEMLHRYFSAAQQPKATKVLELPSGPKDPPGPKGPPAAPPGLRSLKELGLTEDSAKDLLEDVLAREAVGLDPAVNVRHFDAGERLAQGLIEKGANLSHYADAPDGRGAMQLERATEQAMEDIFNSLPHLQKETWAQTDEKALAELAEMVNAPNVESLRAKIMRDIPEELRTAERFNIKVQALRSAKYAAYEKAIAASKKAMDPSTPQGEVEAAWAAYQNWLGLAADVGSSVRQMQAIQGRGLSQNRMKREAAKFIIAVGDPGPNGLPTPGGVGRGNKILNAPMYARVGNMGLSYWINAMLSGPRTQLVNFSSNMAVSFYRPVELMMGAAIRGDRGLIDEAFMNIAELVRAIPESFEAAKRAFVDNRALLDPGHDPFDVVKGRSAFTAEALGVESSSPLGQAVRLIGPGVELPSRVLGAVDEFAKQMNYRSVVRTDLRLRGAREGRKGAELLAWVDSQMDDLLWRDQAYTNSRLVRQGHEAAKAAGIVGKDAEDFAKEWARKNFDESKGALAERAVAVAREVTFTEDLREGSLGKKVQEAVTAFPYLKIHMPFVRTPLNLLKFNMQRADMIGAAQYLAGMKFGVGLNALETSQRRMIRDLMSKDPRKNAEAVGRLAGGASVLAFGTTLALQGAITGRGPSDHQQRKVLLDSGWMPYSIKVGNQYFSYTRLDPLATSLGIIADFSDYAKMAPADEQDESSTHAVGLAVALANNLTNKSYLAGLQNLVQTMSDPERFFPAMVKRYAASAVPNILGQATFAAGGDETLRDARTWLDAMIAKVPGLSDTLAPQRNVLGEPLFKHLSVGSKAITAWTDAILPIAHSTVSDDLISKEMASLGHGFTPPRRERNGIDLTNIRKADGQDAYDRWGELAGQVMVRGSTLRQALKAKIKSHQYQQLSALSTHDQDSPRIKELKSIIERHRREAWRQLLDEYPELRESTRQYEETRRSLKAGIDPRFLSLR